MADCGCPFSIRAAISIRPTGIDNGLTAAAGCDDGACYNTPPPLDCADKALLVCAPTDSTRTGKFAPAGSTAPEIPGLGDGVSAPAFRLWSAWLRCVLGGVVGAVLRLLVG